MSGVFQVLRRFDGVQFCLSALLDIRAVPGPGFVDDSFLVASACLGTIPQSISTSPRALSPSLQGIKQTSTFQRAHLRPPFSVECSQQLVIAFHDEVTSYSLPLCAESMNRLRKSNCVKESQDAVYDP